MKLVDTNTNTEGTVSIFWNKETRIRYVVTSINWNANSAASHIDVYKVGKGELSYIGFVEVQNDLCKDKSGMNYLQGIVRKNLGV